MIDEVPVEVVVNRLVVHIAYGTYGFVHAVSGTIGRKSRPDIYQAVVKLRRRCWLRPSLQWCDDSAPRDRVCTWSKFYRLFGCSFDFRQERKEKVWQLMDADT